MQIDIWSDVACPWCYIGKRRLEAALARTAQTAAIRWRAFELDPSAPLRRDDGLTFPERIARKYHVSADQAKQMIARVAKLGAEDGLEIRHDIVQSTNTFDAHRLIQLAGDKQGALKERLLRAYHSEGKMLGDRAVLAQLAAEVGIADAAEQLASDRGTAEVRADEAAARELDITGVPFFVLDGRLAVSGAQPVEVMVDALGRAG